MVQIFCIYLFIFLVLSHIIEILMQDSESDSEVLDLFDPSSSNITVGKITLSCSVEVCGRLHIYLIGWLTTVTFMSIFVLMLWFVHIVRIQQKLREVLCEGSYL